MMKMDEHIIEALGKTKIIVRDGKVVDVGTPKIKYCPIFDKYRGIKELTSSSVRENIEFRIADFGMCTPDRILKMRDFLSFGISETLGTLLADNVIDCAVIVCEGCGTVIVTNPELVQGIGGRVSGFLSTTPIDKIIDEVGVENVLNPKNAEIDQVKGTLKAIEKGYKKIAVTVVSSRDAERLKKIEKEHEKVKVYVFAVHLTGISKKDVESLFEHADVITSCASKYVREIGDKRKIFKVGESIPIYATTKDGIDFLIKRIEKIGGLKKKNAKTPEPLI